MGDRKAFFYGTLMAKEILYRVCFGNPKADQDPVHSLLTSQMNIVPAILHDYQRHKIQGYDYPGIRQQEGQEVRGTYVTGLTDACIWKLDEFEGFQYTREKVKVRVLDKGGKEKEEELDAETYVFKFNDCLEKEEWSYEEFRKENLHKWVGGSSTEFDDVDKLVAESEAALDAAV